MDVEFIWNYCLSKNGAEETFPFNPSTLVFKVGGKMFALFDVDNFNGINLKCNPERSIELRESYSGITSAFHMNKKHWITVKINQDVDSSLILELINHSYDLVHSSLSKKIQDGI
jgi:predicted DNA-binding protein (MmcQ/YjbR family)